MAMNPRERNLFMITVIAIGVYVIYSLAGGEDVAAEEYSAGDIATLESQNAALVKNVEEAPRIYQQYSQLVGLGGGSNAGAPGAGGEEVRADFVFHDEVDQWCRAAGFDNPRLEKAVTDIEDVDDYQLIEVTVRVDGDLDRVSRLLKEFDKRGLIIRQVDISVSSRGERLTLIVRVARLVETFMMTKDRQRRLRN